MLTKGVATATDPLIIIITTAGAGQESIGWDMSKKAKAIRDGITKDDTMFVAIYAADAKDDPFSIETLKKANPGYGVIVQEDFLLDQANDAKNNPSEFAAYQRFHLNIWTSTHDAWIEDHFYQNCNQGTVDATELLGQICYTGTDLASTRDLSSTALFFPSDGEGKHKVIMKYWCPDTQVGKRTTDHIDYTAWVTQGFMKPTGGNSQDHRVIVEDIKQLSNDYKILLSGFDRAMSMGVVPSLIESGMEFEPIAQSVGGLSEPMKFLEKLILDGNIEFGGDPILRWQFNNTMVRRGDGADNIYPHKGKSKDKIDGVVALIMAIAVWQIDGSPLRKKNLYNDRGIISI